MINRNRVSTSFKILLALLAVCGSAFAEIGNQLWSFQTGDDIFSSPTIDGDGNVYIGSLDGKLYSIDKDGTERWAVTTGDWIESTAALNADESVVYVGSWDNKLYAIDTASGATLWFYETGTLIFSSPAVASNGDIYFGGTDGFLYALNPDGTLKWDVFLGAEVDSSVAIGPSRNLYCGTSEGYVVSYDTSGLERWSVEVPDETGAASRDKAVNSSCMLSGTGELYFGSNNFFVYALDTSDGSMLWSYETDGEIDASPTMSMDGNILVSSYDGFLYSLDTDGALVWRSDIGANYFTAAVVDEIGRIYVSSYISDTLSYLNLISPGGVILQQVSFPDIIDSSVSLSPDGTLYVGSYDGKLYAFANQARLSDSVWPKFRQGLASKGNLTGYAPPVANKERLYNISLRASPLGGEQDLIAGFVVAGSGEKKLLVRGIGPGLEQHGVPDFLEDPTFTFYNSQSVPIGTNNDWGDSAFAGILAAEMSRVGAFAIEEGSTDSAEILTLTGGAYTAIASNAGGEDGVVLVEVYDADEVVSDATLANISMRGRVGQGAEVLIAGFVIEGNLPKRLLIRAIGSGLLDKGVVNVVADPTMTLYRGPNPITTNDDWDAHPERAQLESFMANAGAFPLDEGSGDSAIFVWLEPGPFTVIISGVGGQTGVALVEIYDLTGI